MRFTTIFRVLGVFLMLFSISMLPPVLISEIYHDETFAPFMLSFCITLLTGFILWLPFRKSHAELKVRDGFLVVVLFWTVLGLYGALPLMFSAHPDISFHDAVFESVSGLTTTGATVLTAIDHLPPAILYYRQQLQFLGGMGIVVLAVAILPMLGIGGLQLYRAEIPGPKKDSKLTPRIAESAQALWYIYLGLTVACCLAYWAAGMSLFDALGESFATISTGGFTMHNESFAFYQSPIINLIAVFFMMMGSTNFALHFYALQRSNFSSYWQDYEFRVYIMVLIAACVITSAVLIFYQTYASPTRAISEAVFDAVSLGTNTGFVTAPFQSWPTFLPLFLMLLTMIGGCAASTSGGIKIVRVLIMFKQGLREVARLIHPKAILTIKLGRHSLSESLIQSVWSFIAAFTVLFIILAMVLMATGMNLETAFGSLVACLANAGVAIGDVANNFAGVDTTAKWVLIFSMLAGRLEIFTVIVLLTPAFWRK